VPPGRGKLARAAENGMDRQRLQASDGIRRAGQGGAPRGRKIGVPAGDHRPGPRTSRHRTPVDRKRDREKHAEGLQTGHRAGLFVVWGLKFRAGPACFNSFG